MEITAERSDGGWRVKPRSGRGCFARFRRDGLVVMLGSVETENILTLPRSRIDCPYVLPPIHFPNSRNHSILLNCMVRDIFRRNFSRRTLTWCIGRAVTQRGFVLRHFYGNTPLKTS